MTVALALGGGAPNLTLMTGALLALDEAGVEPKVITTTGAGMVAGLLYAAPRKEHPDEDWVTARRRALKSSREMGIDDFIYDQLPMNFKIFQKGGTMAEAWAQVFGPAIWSIPRETRRQRLLGDTLGLMSAILQPGYMALESKGICQPPPWIDLIVDFNDLEGNLSEAQIDFLLTAFCIEDKKERNFRNSEISAEQFKAALAMPFLYSPYKLAEPDGTVKTYLEASAFRTMEFNPEGVMTDRGIETVVYFDLMGNQHLIGEPKNIIDAWGKSIVAPLTQLARQQVDIDLARRGEVAVMKKMGGWLLDTREHVEDLLDVVHHVEAAIKTLERKAKKIPEMKPILDEFRKTVNEKALTRERHDEIVFADDFQLIGRKLRTMLEVIQQGDEIEQQLTQNLLRMPFGDHIPEEQWPFVLDWSHSNMSRLFDIGYETAQSFLDRHWDKLGIAQDGRPDPVTEEEEEGDVVFGWFPKIHH